MKIPPLLQRDLVVTRDKRINLPGWKKILHGDSGYESGFVLTTAPVRAKNQTRFLVRKVGERLLIYAILSLYNKNPAKGDDPHAGPEYSGNISLTFGPTGDGIGQTVVTFTEGRDPDYRRALIDEAAKSTAWPPMLPLEWSFAHAFNNRGCAFESEEVFFFAAFNEREIFAFSDRVGFNVSRIDSDANEVSSWNFMAGMGTLARDAQVKIPVRRPPVVSIAKNFRISVTNDILMVMRHLPYSRENLAAEMRTLKAWGVERIHWIDNTGYPAAPGSNYLKSLRQCGPLLPAGCRAAKAHQLEFVADIKLYDLSFLTERTSVGNHSAVPVFDGSNCLSFSPEMSGRTDIFVSSHPDWRRKTAFPLTTLRFFSLEPFPSLKSSDIILEESADNLHYRPVERSKLKVRVRTEDRPNRRWHVDKVRPEAGHAACWVLELSGLNINHPFLSIRIKRPGVNLLNLQFAALEAVNEAGDEAPFLFGRGGGELMPFEAEDKTKAVRRYKFSVDGMLSGGDEPVVSFGRWSLGDLGVSFLEPDSIPGMMEPTHPAVHKIWLDRIDYFLKHDVDGISIRPLRHHRGCHSWTRFSYAQPVRQIFQKRYGRLVTPTEEDILRVREIRGEGFGEFLREASWRTRRRGKKFIFQIELTGGSLEAVNTRMGFSYNLKKWIAEGMFDEIHARPISGHSPWMRTVLLPYAGKHGVDVHIVTPNATAGYNHAEYLEYERVVTDGIELGYSGINFYESVNLYDLTEANTIQPRALAETVLKRAKELAIRHQSGKLKAFSSATESGV